MTGMRVGCAQVALDDTNLLRTWDPALQVSCRGWPQCPTCMHMAHFLLENYWS